MVRFIQKCALIIVAVVYIGFIFIYPIKCGICEPDTVGSENKDFLIRLLIGLLIVAPTIGALWPRQRRSNRTK